MSTLVKSLALFAVSAGARVPENPVTRFQELAHLKQLLARLGIDCVLDVGANQGQFATELRRLGYRKRILSFEPVAREFDVLRTRFAGDAAWQGFPYALGQEDKSTQMNVFSDLTVMSSLLTPLGKQKNVHVQSVEVKRLDGLLPAVLPDLKDARIFLKMDTQGFDLEVFKGAHGVLGRVFGLQSELSVRPLYRDMPHYIEALSTYEAAGFDLSNLTVVSRTSEMDLQELNCFMVKRN
jgi:FkbM family methyltransferase